MGKFPDLHNWNPEEVILTTGGVGYIGSQLFTAGHEVVVLDDVQRGQTMNQGGYAKP